MEIGSRRRRARTSQGLTQKQLGEKVGVAQATVAIWETRRTIPTKQIVALEQVLGPLKQRKGRSNQPSPIPLTSSFGAWLRDQRMAAAMSVIELAEKSQVSAPAIYNLESGRIENPQAATRDKLAKAFSEKVPKEVIKETEEDQIIKGLGTLIDFDPHLKIDWPTCAGVYVFYDISQRPIYVGKSRNIATRLEQHLSHF